MPAVPVPEDVSDEVASLFRHTQDAPDWVGSTGTSAPATIAEQLVAAAQSLIGGRYERGGGHGALAWPPGPLDCSGLLRVVFWHVTGKDLLDSNSEGQFGSRLGGEVPSNGALLGGDAIFFVGDPIDPSPGHVGYVVTYDEITGTGTFCSALDTASGVVTVPFDRFDGEGPLKVVGVLRVANAVHPSPPPTPPAPKLPRVDQFITLNPIDQKGDYLCSWSTRRAVGIPSTAVEQQIESTGVTRHNISAATFAYFVPEVWAAAPAK